MSAVELLWDARCELAESPVWDAQARRYPLLRERQQRADSRLRVDDGRQERWRLPEPVASFGMCRSGRLVVALSRRLVFLDLDTGKVTPLTGELAEPAGNQFNDGRPGPDGCYWVGTRDGRRPRQLGSTTIIPDPNGGLYRIGPDGSAVRAAAGYLSSNGLAFAPDGDIMYHSDSANDFVDRLGLQPRIRPGSADGDALPTSPRPPESPTAQPWTQTAATGRPESLRDASTGLLATCYRHFRCRAPRRPCRVSPTGTCMSPRCAVSTGKPSRASPVYRIASPDSFAFPSPSLERQSPSSPTSERPTGL